MSWRGTDRSVKLRHNYNLGIFNVKKSREILFIIHNSATSHGLSGRLKATYVVILTWALSAFVWKLENKGIAASLYLPASYFLDMLEMSQSSIMDGSHIQMIVKIRENSKQADDSDVLIH